MPPGTRWGTRPASTCTSRRSTVGNERRPASRGAVHDVDAPRGPRHQGADGRRRPARATHLSVLVPDQRTRLAVLRTHAAWWLGEQSSDGGAVESSLAALRDEPPPNVRTATRAATDCWGASSTASRTRCVMPTGASTRVPPPPARAPHDEPPRALAAARSHCGPQRTDPSRKGRRRTSMNTSLTAAALDVATQNDAQFTIPTMPRVVAAVPTTWLQDRYVIEGVVSRRAPGPDGAASPPGSPSAPRRDADVGRTRSGRRSGRAHHPSGTRDPVLGGTPGGG